MTRRLEAFRSLPAERDSVERVGEGRGRRGGQSSADLAYVRREMSRNRLSPAADRNNPRRRPLPSKRRARGGECEIARSVPSRLRRMLAPRPRSAARRVRCVRQGPRAPGWSCCPHLP